jgi:hypothetical protein
MNASSTVSRPQRFGEGKGGSITGFNESMQTSTRSPEPSTWVMLGIGFGLMGWDVDAAQAALVDLSRLHDDGRRRSPTHDVAIYVPADGEPGEGRNGYRNCLCRFSPLFRV